MYRSIKMKWIAMLLCMSLSVPVYAAEADTVPVPVSEISASGSLADQTVAAGDDSVSPVGVPAEETTDELTEAGLGTLPSKLDPRDDPWYITPIRNQGRPA